MSVQCSELDDVQLGYGIKIINVFSLFCERQSMASPFDEREQWVY